MKDFSCALCGSKEFTEKLRITQPDRFETFAGISPEGYSRSWIACLSCGLVFDRHLPQNEKKILELGTAYYEADFQNSTIAEKYQKIMGLPAEKSDNAKRVLRMHAFLHDWFAQEERHKTKRILDVGAGTGVFLAKFLDEAKHRGAAWSAVGIESDPQASEHLRTLKRFEVIEGIFPGTFELRDFDLCTLNKVVEHMPEPVFFMKAVANTLRKDRGVVYCEVPDKLTINHRPSTDNILGSVHCHLYDVRTLALLLETAGFVVLRIDRFLEPSGKITVAAFAVLTQAFQKIIS